MTDTAAPPPKPHQDLLARVSIWLSVLGLIGAIATEIPNTITNFYSLVSAHSVAINAAVKERAEAEKASAAAAEALAVANNTADTVKAETEVAELSAVKLEQDAIKARAEADNARAKTKADTDAALAVAASAHAKTQVTLQEMRNAAIQKRTEVELADQNLKTSRYTLRQSVYMGNMINCPGTTYIAKIDAADKGLCRLPHFD